MDQAHLGIGQLRVHNYRESKQSLSFPLNAFIVVISLEWEYYPLNS